MKGLKESLGIYLTNALDSSNVKNIANEYQSVESLLHHLKKHYELDDALTSFEAEIEVRNILQNRVGLLMLSASKSEEKGKQDSAEKFRKEALELSQMQNVSRVENFIKSFML